MLIWGSVCVHVISSSEKKMQLSSHSSNNWWSETKLKAIRKIDSVFVFICARNIEGEMLVECCGAAMHQGQCRVQKVFFAENSVVVAVWCLFVLSAKATTTLQSNWVIDFRMLCCNVLSSNCSKGRTYTPAPHPTPDNNNENGICTWYAYILNDINNGYIGGACPYKNNGFGGVAGMHPTYAHAKIN